MMSFSLPGIYLYYLPKDDLAPEEYERIISPIFAWMHIREEYEFDDAHDRGFRLVNMHKRPCDPNPHQPRRYGPREAYRFRRRSVLLNALTGCQGPHKAPPFAKGDYKAAVWQMEVCLLHAECAASHGNSGGNCGHLRVPVPVLYAGQHPR
ncbi:hypothetical protein [Pantoea sp. CCBC3-3-1]|uniref:hypothetical protein n=1 Tax=Pantoea sp. CCBC3-3-1 TaxID=2490851 RepID=UPI0020C48BCC|nr:hypothetical protein [Pantoea sp. CCBC3-3-1]